jgi:hypothetical protein
VSGGGVIFDIAQPGDSYSAREPEPIAPGAEFPILNAAEAIPGSAKVSKWGGKIKVTDEKRDRDEDHWLRNEQIRMGNSLARQLHRNAIAAIDAAVTAYSRTDTWTTAFASLAVVGATQTAATARPAADVYGAQAVADSNNYEVSYDTLLVNTMDMFNLRSVSSVIGVSVDDIMFPDGNGMVISTNLISQGTSYLIAAGRAGQTRWEKPLGTVVFREEEIETTWIQSSARAVYFVDNPYAILKFTGG